MIEEIKNKFTVKKILMLLAGMLLINFGIALSIQANLGTSPVSSTPYVLAQFTSLTVGNWTILIHCLAVLLQIIILRKDYNPFNLLQIVLAFVFGYMTDFCIWIVGDINCPTYISKLLVCIASIVLIGIGVALEVEANVLMVALEGLAYTIATKFNKVFGNIKSIQDCTLVAIACIIGLLAFRKIIGVREGTVLAAVFVGQIAKLVRSFVFRK